MSCQLVLIILKRPWWLPKVDLLMIVKVLRLPWDQSFVVVKKNIPSSIVVLIITGEKRGMNTCLKPELESKQKLLNKGPHIIKEGLHRTNHQTNHNWFRRSGQLQETEANLRDWKNARCVYTNKTTRIEQRHGHKHTTIWNTKSKTLQSVTKWILQLTTTKAKKKHQVCVTNHCFRLSQHHGCIPLHCKPTSRLHATARLRALKMRAHNGRRLDMNLPRPGRSDQSAMELWALSALAQ